MSCDAPGATTTSLDPEIRALLVCPVCRGELIDVPAGLMCPADRLTFPVVDGVPWMLPERARRATDGELDVACALWDREADGEGD